MSTAARVSSDNDVSGSRTRPPVLTSVSMRPVIFVDEATEDGPALDPLLGRVGEGVVGPGGCSRRLRWSRRPL